MVGRQCGPKLLNRSESTIRGPLHVSRPGQLGYLGSVSPQFFSSPLKLRCVHTRIRAGLPINIVTKKKVSRPNLENRANVVDQAHI